MSATAVLLLDDQLRPFRANVYIEIPKKPRNNGERVFIVEKMGAPAAVIEMRIV
jgi:hypothetical protein